MNRSIRALRTVPALLLALAVTIGWADASPASSHDAASADRFVTAGASGLPSYAAPAAIGSQPGSLALAAANDEPVPDRSLWRPTSAVQPAPAAAPKASAKPKAKTQPAPAPTIVRNHFWIPKLGMSYHVYTFECTRKRPPDNLIYRWGCAGKNNVYILGHAYGVMKPLHDLYVRGGLKVGMIARYADRKGVVHTYRVTTWQVVEPVEVEWAIASQAVPSMTLQTCVGKDSRYRLNVRLVEI